MESWVFKGVKKVLQNQSLSRLLLGRILTNIADSFINILIIWYFNEQYHSPVLLSVVFAVTSGIDALSFLLGPLVDHMKERRLLITSSLFQVIISAGLLGVVLAKNQLPNHWLASILVVGLALIYLFSSIIYPLETKILPKIVDKSQLVSANSLFQLAYKVLDISFNALATLFVAWFSLSVNFLLIFFIFFLATVMYRYFKIKADTITNVQSIATYHDYFQELLSGVRVLRKAPQVYQLFLPLAFVNFFYAISLVALPMFSKLYISSSSIGYGIVLMTSSLGGIAGAFFLNRLKLDIAKPVRFIALMMLLSGLSQIGFSFLAPVQPIVSLSLFFMSSLTMSMMNIVFVTLEQQSIESAYLGRVSMLTESLISVMIPLGSLVAGLLLKFVPILLVESMEGFALVLACGYYRFIYQVPKNEPAC